MANSERSEEDLMQAFVESENPVEYFRTVARNGHIGFEEFRLILQTPFQGFLSQTIRSFIDNIPPGTPGIAQIRNLALESVRGFQLQSDVILRQLFKFLDRNADGEITEGEFVEALTLLTRRDFRALFNVLDLNGDGFITEEELMAFFKDAAECALGLADSFLDVFTDTVLFQSDVIKNALTLLWMFVDSDGDGAITAEDLVNLVPPPMTSVIDQQLEMLLNFPGPLSEIFNKMLESESSMREKFTEAIASSPDGHVSEAIMYSLILNSTRDELRNQVPVQMDVFLQGAPPQIRDNKEIRDLVTSTIPSTLERKFPSYFRALFKLLDKDGDGRISQAEFDAMYAVLRCLKPEASGHRVKACIEGVIQVFDVSMSGKVTVDQADEVIKKILMVIREIVHVTLAIAKETIVKIVETQPVKDFIALLDTNADGKISLAEFQDHLAHSPLPRQLAMLLNVEATPTPPVGAADPFLASGDNANA